DGPRRPHGVGSAPPSVGVLSGNDRGERVPHQILKDLTTDRCGDTAAGATLLDQDHDHVLRVVDRCHSYEPGVVVAGDIRLAGTGLASDAVETVPESDECLAGGSGGDHAIEIGQK